MSIYLSIYSLPGPKSLFSHNDGHLRVQVKNIRDQPELKDQFQLHHHSEKDGSEFKTEQAC